MPSLVLIPGLLSDEFVWQHQINYLQHHANIMVANLSGASTPNEMIDAVLSEAPGHFALAGHSMGGWIALEIMRYHAHRVTKLLLANTTALLDSPQKAASRNNMLKMAYENNEDAIVDLLLQAFLFQKQFSPAVKAMFKRNMKNFINQEKAMLQREDCVPILNRIQCPTLIIHANQDAVFDISDSMLMHAQIAGSRIAKIDNCGHMSPIEAADEVIRLMNQWLDE